MLKPPLYFFFFLLSLFLSQTSSLKSTPSDHIYDYIIIGAGLSGLQSAEILLKHNHKNILILEADHKIGGKVNGVKLSFIEQFKEDGHLQIQIGASQIDNQHTVIRRLIKDMQLQTYMDEDHPGDKDLFIYEDQQIDEVKLIHHPIYGKEVNDTLNQLLKDGKAFGKAFESVKTSRNPQDIELLSNFSKISASNYFTNLNISTFTKSYYENRMQIMNCMLPQKTPMDIILKAVYHANDYFNFKEKFDLKDVGKAFGMEQQADQITKGLQQSIQEIVDFRDICKLGYQVVEINNQDFEKGDITIKAKIHKQNQSVSGMITLKAKKVISALPLAAVNLIKISYLSPSKRYILSNMQKSSMKKTYVISQKRISQGENQHIHDLSFATKQYNCDLLFNHFDDKSIAAIGFFHTNARLPEFDKLTKPQKTEYLKKLIKVSYKITQDDIQGIKNLEDSVFYEVDTQDQIYWRSAFGESEAVGTYADVLEMGDTYEAHNRNEYGIIFIGGQIQQKFVDHMEGAVRSARIKTFEEIGEIDPYKDQFIAHEEEDSDDDSEDE